MGGKPKFDGEIGMEMGEKFFGIESIKITGDSLSNYG